MEGKGLMSASAVVVRVRAVCRVGDCDWVMGQVMGTAYGAPDAEAQQRPHSVPRRPHRRRRQGLETDIGSRLSYVFAFGVAVVCV